MQWARTSAVRWGVCGRASCGRGRAGAPLPRFCFCWGRAGVGRRRWPGPRPALRWPRGRGVGGGP
eukprot:6910710-Lingulodinium_polyedra.AAC.1